MANNTINGFNINGTYYDLDCMHGGSQSSGLTDAPKDGKTYGRKNGEWSVVGSSSSVDMTDGAGQTYSLKVNDNGELYAYPLYPDVPQASKPTQAGVVKFNGTTKLYINSLYCGGTNSDEHTINYCSHNFVELSNMTGIDINLKGIFLKYTKDGSDWKSLPLEGVIKNGSTFLVRGARCSVKDSTTVKIDVNSYDMDFPEVKFDETKAKFFLTFNEGSSKAQPWNDTSVNEFEIGYIDLIGINSDGYEGATYNANGGLKRGRLFKKYYSMDPVKQATKADISRSNAKDWNYVDLTLEDGDLIDNIEEYTPKASFQHKDIWYDKTKLKYGKPTVITCSFGIQANAVEGGIGATRCFNWMSRGVYDEYVWVKKDRSDFESSDAHESFKNDNGGLKYYNRIIAENANGTVFTVHKYIIKNLSKGTYYYVAGQKNADGTPNMDKCTDVRTFVVKSDKDLESGFSFVQTSDQQGFNWAEYQVWAAASKAIMKENPNKLDFMINTGDMAQNGNRMNEWFDYFNGKCDDMQNIAEMATIGNNDLSGLNPFEMISGEDDSKYWMDNFKFFYTFELDADNLPVGTLEGMEIYIPSLYSFNYGNTHFMCINSEIKMITETEGYGLSDGKQVYDNIVKAWCKNDIEKNKKDFNIAYCHEMPFTIITTGSTKNPATTTTGTAERKGSSLNTNTNTPYWFSEFCQNNGIKLVLGGHKHTQSLSQPLLENVKYDGDTRTVDSFRPIIVVSDDIELVEYSNDKVSVKLPKDISDEVKATLCYMGTFINEKDLPEGVNPVVYSMSQATGYKHTSNKELPGNGTDILWLKYYFPCTAAVKADSGQKYPFYTVWTVDGTQIKGEVRKVDGIMNAGNFDINTEYPYVKKGINSTDRQSQIASINGFVKAKNIKIEKNSDGNSVVTSSIVAGSDDTTIIIKK